MLTIPSLSAVFVLAFTLSFPATAFAQSKAKRPAEGTAKKSPKVTASADLPKLPMVQWPFAKPSDPEVQIGYVPRKLGLMHSDAVYVEPVLMKKDKTVLYQFGAGLMVGGIGAKNLQVEEIPVSLGIENGKVIIATTKEFATTSTFRVSASDYRGTDPFLDVTQSQPALFEKRPTTYGIALMLPAQSFPIGYDLRSFVRTIFSSNNKDVIEYGIAYLTCCTFPRQGNKMLPGERAIPPSELQDIMVKYPYESNVNDSEVAKRSAVARATALVNLLNHSMQRWAKSGYHLYDLQSPVNNVDNGKPISPVFSQLRLPVHELKLANDYAKNAQTMSGPDRLVLRMTSNRILLDRILVSGWACDSVMNGQGAQGRPNYVFANNELNQWGERFAATYGLGMGFVEMSRRMDGFAVSVSPTPTANQTMEKLEIPVQ